MTRGFITTRRFTLRQLRVDDVTERYLGWLRDEAVRKYIDTAAATTTIEELRRYVADRSDRDDVLFLGIFDRRNGVHVGNVKFEPIDDLSGYAVMGILIGDPSYRGTGAAQEVLDGTGRWLSRARGVKEMVLGVNADNTAAIRAYEKVGFVAQPTGHIPLPAPGTITMVWNIAHEALR